MAEAVKSLATEAGVPEDKAVPKYSQLAMDERIILIPNTRFAFVGIDKLLRQAYDEVRSRFMSIISGFW